MADFSENILKNSQLVGNVPDGCCRLGILLWVCSTRIECAQLSVCLRACLILLHV